MRTVIAITTLALSATGAHAAEDRYGPPPTPAMVSVAAATGPTQVAQATAAPSVYTGRMLGWSGKTDPRAIAAPTPDPVPAAPSYAPTPVVARAAAPVQAAPRYQPRAQAPLPQSLYDRPAATPVSAPAPTPSSFRTPVIVRAPGYRPSYQPQAQVPAAQGAYDRPAAPAPAIARTPAAPAPAPAYAAAPVVERAPAFQPRYQPLPTRDQPQAPQSGYGRPASPAAVATRAPTPASAAAVAPQPRQAATVTPPAPVAARGPAPARAYSVLREFGGGQPDPIALPPPLSYWATREDARVLADPTYGEGLSKKSGEAVPREDSVDGGVAPRPSERKR